MPALLSARDFQGDEVHRYIMPRSLLECIQFVRRTAVQTAVHVITTGALIALLTGIAMKLRWFGPNP